MSESGAAGPEDASRPRSSSRAFEEQLKRIRVEDVLVQTIGDAGQPRARRPARA